MEKTDITLGQAVGKIGKVAGIFLWILFVNFFGAMLVSIPIKFFFEKLNLFETFGIAMFIWMIYKDLRKQFFPTGKSE